MSSSRDWPFYSAKRKCHGVNVQVIADHAGRLIWASLALPGARHDMGAAREHGIVDAIDAVGVRAVADTAYQGAGPAVARPAASPATRSGHRAATNRCPAASPDTRNRHRAARGGQLARRDTMTLADHINGTRHQRPRRRRRHRLRLRLACAAVRISDHWVQDSRDPASTALGEERAALVRSYAALLAAVHS
jgi:hypothetical protein